MFSKESLRITKFSKNEPSKEDDEDDEKSKKFDWRQFNHHFHGRGKYYAAGVAVTLLGIGLYTRDYLNLYPKIDFNQFQKGLTEKQISEVTVIVTNYSSRSHSARVTFSDGRVRALPISNVDSFVEALENWQRQSGTTATLVPLYYSNRLDLDMLLQRWGSIFSSIFGIIAFGALMRSISTTSMMTQGMEGATKKVSDYILEKEIKTRFKDVAGLHQAKMEIQEFVEFLKNPKKYKRLGAKIPKGALLSGPPGTGKTLLAKACAGEAGVTFLSLSGSEFVELYVGVGASKVRKLFEEARKNSPSIIFIDEIDAIGKKRDSSGNSGSSEWESTLNQLLVELDGFGTEADVVVFAATNRKELLDDALVRTGRFDRSIEITLPDIESRKEIFDVHLKALKLSDERTIDRYAKRLSTLTPGFSGSDIASICNEAAIQAARRGADSVTPHDFEMAVERVIGGLEKKRIVSDKERETVAVHESGHAVVSWFLKGGDPLLKLTIIPRSKGSLGFAQYLPNESSLDTKSDLFDKICKILGGRVAEEVFFGQITTGAHDDLNKAYEMARNMVIKLGMSDRIGYVNYQESEDFSKTYSSETNKVIFVLS